MKLFVVLVVVVIFFGPTLAKRFSPEPEPAPKRGPVYRLVRRVGLVRALLLAVLIVVVAPTVIWLLLR